MIAMLKLVPDVIKIPASMVVGAGLAFYPVKWYGAAQEKNRAEAAQLAKTIEIIRGRAATDKEVVDFGAAAMCAALGLSEDNARECVRRMAEANPVLADVCDDIENGPPLREPSGGPQRIRR
jgi:type II secretory pathway component PulJ